MPLIRIKKHAHNYLIVDKTGIEDVRLSFRARGVLLYLLTKPDEWEVDVRQLASQAREGRDAIYAALSELERAGYSRKIMLRNPDGTLQGYQTWISEHPDILPTESGFSGIGPEQASMRVSTESGKPGTGSPNPENQELVFTPTIKVSKDLKSKKRSKTREDLQQPPPPPSSSSTEEASVATITTPEAFVALYNANIPEGIPMVKTLSPERRERIRKYLKDFPDRLFWITCFRAPATSPFLRGERARPGHERFKFDLDFLLRKGKDGIENCVKVYEGKYADAPPQEDNQTATSDAMADLSPRTQAIMREGKRGVERMMNSPRWNPTTRTEHDA